MMAQCFSPTILIASPTTTTEKDSRYQESDRRQEQAQAWLREFIRDQHQNLARDTAAGRGEYLNSAADYLAIISGEHDRECFFQAAQARFSEIFPPGLKYDAPGKLSESDAQRVLDGFVRVWKAVPPDKNCAAPSGNVK